MITKKILLPFIIAIAIIGMSFSMGNIDEPTKTASDYIRLNGSWEAISERDCGSGDETCKVKFTENGQPYDVYDEMSFGSLKESPDGVPILITP